MKGRLSPQIIAHFENENQSAACSAEHDGLDCVRICLLNSERQAEIANSKPNIIVDRRRKDDDDDDDVH